MIRDYTKEVGLASHKKTMPRVFAFALLAGAAVGASLGVAGVVSHTKQHHATTSAKPSAPP